MVTIDPNTGEMVDTGFSEGHGYGAIGKLKRRFPDPKDYYRDDVPDTGTGTDTGVLLPPMGNTTPSAPRRPLQMASTGDPLNGPSLAIRKDDAESMAGEYQEDQQIKSQLHPDPESLPSTGRIHDLEGQLSELIKKPSVKQRLLNLAIQAAPIVIGGLVDGSAGVEGAAEGVGEAMNTQYERRHTQEKDLRTDLENERQRQERQYEAGGNSALKLEQMKALREYRKRGFDEKGKDRTSREGMAANSNTAAQARQDDQQAWSSGEKALDRQAAQKRAETLAKRASQGVWVATTDERGNIAQFYNNKNPQMTMAPTTEGMRKSGLPVEEFATQGGLKILGEQFNKIRDLANQHPEYIGPAAGRWGKIETNYLADWIGANPDQADLYQTIDDASNQLVYLLSGKQINEQEYHRLNRALPHANLPTATFMARLDNFEYRLQEVLASRRGSSPVAGAASKLNRSPKNKTGNGTGKSGKNWREVTP